MDLIKRGIQSKAYNKKIKCVGKEDVVTGILQKPFGIRLLEHGHYFCFDVRTLKSWFESGKFTNPLTNLMLSQVNIDKVYRKLVKIERDKAIAAVSKELIEGYNTDKEIWIYEIDLIVDANRNRRPPLNYMQILDLAETAIQTGILQDRLDEDPSRYYH